MFRNSHLKPLAGATLVVVGLFGAVTGTFASFVARTSNPGNGFAMTSLYAPSGLTTTEAPRSVALTWQAGRNGSGYRILTAPAPNPTSSSCAGASFTPLTTVSGVTYTDARFAPQGTYQCYKVETSYASWTSVDANPVVSAHLGFVVTDVQLVNGGTAGQLDPGDRMVVTFNHPVTTATGPLVTHSICSVAGGPIVLASSTVTGGCAASEATSLGHLAGGSVDRAARFAISGASWNAASTMLTVTLGNRTVGPRNPAVSGPWTLTPTSDATKLLSASGAHHVCDSNAGGGNCTRLLATNF